MSLKKSAFKGWLTLLLVAVAAPAAMAGLRADALSARSRVLAPASGVELEFKSSQDGRLLAVLAAASGEPLPAEPSIVVELEGAGHHRAFSAYVPGGVLGPYWTSPDWTDLTALNPGTQFALWQEPSGEWGAMIPLVGGGLSTRLEGTGSSVVAAASSFSEGFAPSLVPILAVGFGDDPYRLTRDLYSFGFEVMREADPEGVIGRLRWEKEYPEVFRYIGYCSWNSHYRYVSAKRLMAHVESFKRAGFPMGFILIDDGWQTVSKLTMIPWSQGRLYMTAFEANHKFPGGLRPLVDRFKNDYGIRFVGTWKTFQGYWNGIALDSELGRAYRDSLLPVKDDPRAAVPDPRSEAGARFWLDWFEHLSGQGIDFIKVDNQSTLSSLVGHVLPVSKAMAQSQHNLEIAAAKHFNSQVINCMEMNIDVVYQWRTTNIARSSVDYVPIFYNNPRTHVVKNVMNAMWLGNLAWPDYDMVKTHDQHMDYHMASKALSGGPVYITDNAGRERFELLWPLILSTGELIRVDEPGLPIRKSLLANPYRDRLPLAAFARVGESGMLAAWAVDSFERSVRMRLEPADVEGIEGDRFAVFDYYGDELMVKGLREEWEVRLGRWGVKLYSVVPIKDGFAPVGLADKYVSPGTVKKVVRKEGGAVIELAEPGRFLAYSERAPEQVIYRGEVLPADRVSYERGRLMIDLSGPVKAEPARIEIWWK